MSWDVSILAGPDPPNLEKGSGWEPPPMGTPEEVRRLISAGLNDEVAWWDDGWGQYGGDGFTFELDTGEDNPVTSVTVHVRGGGNPLPALFQIASPHGWYLLDWSTGDLLNAETPCSSWEAWQDYAARIRGAEC